MIFHGNAMKTGVRQDADNSLLAEGSDPTLNLNQPLVVDHWSKSLWAGETRVSARVDGYEVYFQGASLEDAPARADAFLAVTLLQAMQQNRVLDLSALPPVSSGLLARITEIQDIWCCWNPLLHRVQIRAVEAPTPPGTQNLTFFSGGVDAVHTAMSLGDKAGRLVFVNGFDFELDDAAFAASKERVERIAAQLGQKLLTVKTNWIAYTRSLQIARSTSHGTCLAAVAHLHNPPNAHIASSTSWLGLYPWGTHPFTDKLWGSDHIVFHHHGKNTTRPEKIAFIAKRPELLKHLWVCHDDPVRNCGKCKKCLRTHAALVMAGADTSAFPATQQDIVRTWLLEESTSHSETAFLQEVLLAVQATGRQDLLNILAYSEKAVIRRSVMRRLWRRLLPGLASKRDKKTDLLPWGSGPRPDL